MEHIWKIYGEWVSIVSHGGTQNRFGGTPILGNHHIILMCCVCVFNQICLAHNFCIFLECIHILIFDILIFFDNCVDTEYRDLIISYLWQLLFFILGFCDIPPSSGCFVFSGCRLGMMRKPH